MHACSDACVVCSPPGVVPDADEIFDVIVTEIFDSELLGEGILPTMRHAAAKLLKVMLRGAVCATMHNLCTSVIE